jgi:hypothetical protein
MQIIYKIKSIKLLQFNLIRIIIIKLKGFKMFNVFFYLLDYVAIISQHGQQFCNKNQILLLFFYFHKDVFFFNC